MLLDSKIPSVPLVAAGSTSVRWRLEESDTRHAEGNAAVKDANGVVTKAGETGENHTNINVSLGGTWQMWNGTNWTGTGSPAAANDTGTPKKYRTILDWNTTSEQSYADPDADGPLFASRLLGHNGPHRAVVYKGDAEEDKEIGFQTKDGDDVYGEEKAAGPLPVGVDVGNLVITDVRAADGNLDYFKFDSESEQTALTNPSVTFTVKDDGDSHRYRWYLWAKPTSDEPNSIAVTGILAGPGTKNVVLNLTSAQQAAAGYTQDHPLTDWGTYTFDVRVQEIKNEMPETNLDKWEDWRSQKLKIPYNYTHEGVTDRGHKLWLDSDEETGDMTAKVSYYLEDNEGAPIERTKNAVNGRVDFLDPTFDVIAGQALQPEVRQPRGPDVLYNFTGDEALSETQQDGTFRAIFTAEDDHSSSYREHFNKRIVPVNAPAKIRYFHIEDDWMKHPSKGNTYPQARTNELKKAFWRANWRVLNATNSSQVSTLATTITDEEFRSSMDDDEFNFSKKNFYYYDAQNAPYPSKGFKFGRYVHVIGAWWFTPFTPATEFLRQAQGRSNPNSTARYSYVYIGEVMTPLTKAHKEALIQPVIKRITIHEVGHQFMPAESAHPDQDGVESAAFSQGNINVLKKYRTWPEDLVGPIGTADLKECVFHPVTSIDIAIRGVAFCKTHRLAIQNYSWPNP